MSTEDLIQPERIRLVFELERADNPLLYDDLIQCKKGSKRVNRLRTLAHEGALAQRWSSKGGGIANAIVSQAFSADAVGVSVTNQVFDDPLIE